MFHYLNELSHIGYEGITETGDIEIEVEGKIEPIPDERRDEEIVFLGKMGGTIYLITGQLSKYEYVNPDDSQQGDDFTRISLTMGNCVTLY